MKQPQYLPEGETI